MEGGGAAREAREAPLASYDQTAQLVLHGAEYLVHCFVEGDALHVELEHAASGERWRGRFAAAAIEEMTQKTGNFKRFATFVRMLATALARTSDSVFVDLLTVSDLEAIRAKRDAASSSSSLGASQASVAAAPSARQSNKRFLILTYVVEFDRVHYPLPLRHDDTPPTEALQRTVARLAAEVETWRARATASAGGEQAKLQAENERLREELSALRRGAPDAAAELQTLREEVARLRAAGANAGSAPENAVVAAELEALREAFRRERGALQQSLDAARREVVELEAENRRLREAETRWRARFEQARAELARSGSSAAAAAVRARPRSTAEATRRVPRPAARASSATQRGRSPYSDRAAAPRRASSRASSRGSSHSNSPRSHASSGGPSPRFDPSAWVQQRKQQQRSQQERRRRAVEEKMQRSRSPSPAPRGTLASSRLSRSSLRSRSPAARAPAEPPREKPAAAPALAPAQAAEFNATREIADIDKRISALQEFLRNAKAGRGAV
jgi:coiled-coil domain-containing protein 61